MIIETKLPRERDPGPYERGRTCATPGCGTILSRSNPGPGCALHHGWREAITIAQARHELEDYAALMAEA